MTPKPDRRRQPARCTRSRLPTSAAPDRAHPRHARSRPLSYQFSCLITLTSARKCPHQNDMRQNTDDERQQNFPPDYLRIVQPRLLLLLHTRQPTTPFVPTPAHMQEPISTTYYNMQEPGAAQGDSASRPLPHVSLSTASQHTDRARVSLPSVNMAGATPPHTPFFETTTIAPVLILFRSTDGTPTKKLWWHLSPVLSRP